MTMPGSLSVPRVFKRPESVLVLVYTSAFEVLLMQRHDNPDFWQSVTGSLEAQELPGDAAARELLEETGLQSGDTLPLVDHAVSRRFPIRGRWRARYAPGVTSNLEHRFSVQLPARLPIRLAADEHDCYRWLAPDAALSLASSATNREAIREVIGA